MPAPLVPVILCGLGSNLYPICDGSLPVQGAHGGGGIAGSSGIASGSGTGNGGVEGSAASADASQKNRAAPLPKALVPLANRPLIAYALQNVLSAGFSHAIVLAPSAHHGAISRALAGVRLVPPPVPSSMEGKKKKEERATAASGSNIYVWEGLAKGKVPSGQAVDSAAIRVELLPLGPFDGALAQASPTDDAKEESSSTTRRRPFSRTAVPGTAELLRWLDTLGRLEADPLVLPVDLLSPSLPLRTLIDAYVSAQASAQGVPTLCCALYERNAGEGTGKEREKDGPPRLLAGFVPTDTATAKAAAGQALVLLEDEPDATMDVSLRNSLLARHPHLRLSTGLLDAHAYILNRRQVLPLLEARRELTSLREHVVPLLAKASWMKGFAEKAGIGALASDDDDDDENAAEGQARRGDDVVDLETLARQGSQTLRHESIKRSTTLLAPAAEGKVRCYAVVTKLGGGARGSTAPGADPSAVADIDPETGLPRFVARANTIPTFLECNRWLLKALSSSATTTASSPFAIPQVLAPASADDGPSSTAGPAAASSSDTAQVSPDSLVAPQARLLDRASIKRSVVGARVEVGRNARISSSILVESCSVGEGAKLENVIVCNGASVGARCNLRDCDVGAGVVVLPDTSAKNEKFVLEEEEDEEEEDDEEEEEEDDDDDERAQGEDSD